MNGRTIARVLLALVIVGVIVGIGVTAYDVGVGAGLAQNHDVVVAPGAYPAAPYVGYGWGFGHGFGFFGFFGFLLFLFLVFALVRAAFGGRRGWGPGAYGHDRGRGDWGREWRGSPWESRAREIHDEWHRTNPDKPESGDPPTTS